MSAVQSLSGAVAAKRHLTRSAAGTARGSRRVVRFLLPRMHPHSPTFLTHQASDAPVTVAGTQAQLGVYPRIAVGVAAPVVNLAALLGADRILAATSGRRS